MHAIHQRNIVFGLLILFHFSWQLFNRRSIYVILNIKHKIYQISTQLWLLLKLSIYQTLKNICSHHCSLFLQSLRDCVYDVKVKLSCIADLFKWYLIVSFVLVVNYLVVVGSIHPRQSYAFSNLSQRILGFWVMDKTSTFIYFFSLEIHWSYPSSDMVSTLDYEMWNFMRGQYLRSPQTWNTCSDYDDFIDVV